MLTAVAGDSLGRVMDTQEPMKMAAAEALYHTTNGAPFSLLTITDLSDQPVMQIRVPHVLSLIEDLSWNGQVPGIDNIQAADAAKYGPGSYVPDDLAHLLVLPGDGRRRDPHDPARRLGDVPRLAQEAR